MFRSVDPLDFSPATMAMHFDRIVLPIRCLLDHSESKILKDPCDPADRNDCQPVLCRVEITVLAVQPFEGNGPIGELDADSDPRPRSESV